ncbi:RNA polymerase sigma factor [Brevundimonas sp.]|uniref:RNA polymerase sigma factor n=1 Tax=Brevundimonas sp. TaxID=1871086 RepID=UPI003567D790
MPHEPAVRAWLRQRGRTPEDIDDLIQEAYAKLSSLTALEAVARPGGYFFQIVRNLLIDHIRRSKVVRIDAVGEIGDLPGHADDLNPERITSDRNELAQVLALIETLPPRCREIFKMRKIEGLSQREIAQRLNVTESVVENDAVKGLALLVRAMATRSPHFDGGRP